MIKKIMCGLIVFLLCLIIVLCIPHGKREMDAKEIEKIFNNNTALISDVKNIVDKKRQELKCDYITINDGINKGEYDKDRDRAYAYRNSTTNKNLIEGSKNIRRLNDIFNDDEIGKIEKVFNFGFISIDEYEGLCMFDERGSLDCYNQLLFTSNNNGFKKYDTDDVILKRINSNWYIYGVR